MAHESDKEIFDWCNPAPRDEAERALHERLAKTWSNIGLGKLFGIKFYTAEEEAKLRNQDFNGDPSTIDPRWIGSGPVTATVTVEASGIQRGQQYRELADLLQGAIPSEVAIELVPWDMAPPDDHQLAR